MKALIKPRIRVGNEYVQQGRNQDQVRQVFLELKIASSTRAKIIINYIHSIMSSNRENIQKKISKYHKV